MTVQTMGAANRENGTSDFNALEFIARQVLNGANTATIVKVLAVNGNAVNVQPLVNQVDGLGNSTPHGVVNGLRFIQLQAGSSGILLTPVVGDIGLAVFADHDTSSVIASKAPANPGSMRRFDFADGIYVTGIGGLNPTPTQFIQLLPGAGGINITSPAAVSINAPTINLNGAITAQTQQGEATSMAINGSVTITQQVTASNIAYTTHTHPYIPGTGAETQTGTPQG